MKLDKPLLWSERIGNELYVYFRGKLIYKRWYKSKSTDKKSSILINEKWPNEWIN